MKQYLISFVEKILNQCDLFTQIYGKSFAKQRLEVNLDKVYMGGYSNCNAGVYSYYNKSITIYSNDESVNFITIADIENNREHQQTILHEAIHAIFAKTKEECVAQGIFGGTGIAEIYENGQELGRGLNEGLTEWICEKTGCGAQAYEHEYNTVNLLELAIGEQAVMKLARGDIRGNVAKLLKMTEKECVRTVSIVDSIYRAENKVRAMRKIIKALEKRENEVINEEDKEKLKNELGKYYDEYINGIGFYVKNPELENVVKYQLHDFRQQLEDWERNLNSNIVFFEGIIFEKYFKQEIESAQNAKRISKKTMQRLSELYNSVYGRDTSGYKRLSQEFKDDIYEQLTHKYRPTILERLTGKRPFSQKQTNLPVVQKIGWAKRLWNKIVDQFVEEIDEGQIKTEKKEEETNAKAESFRRYLRDTAEKGVDEVEQEKTENIRQNKNKDAR
ncbi:MAG: hypothetical protein IJE68_04030 [Clostridia bacterium]|nr:hypothetical protein [Clostridia bacterium]